MRSIRAVCLFVAFFLIFSWVTGQSVSPKVGYVVDSIPVIDDPSKGDDILGEDVSDLTIIKNKDSLKLLGYEQFDVVSYMKKAVLMSEKSDMVNEALTNYCQLNSDRL